MNLKESLNSIFFKDILFIHVNLLNYTTNKIRIKLQPSMSVAILNSFRVKFFQSFRVYNFRMDELSAALGCSQMERIEEILGKRAKVARMYGERLAEVEEVQVPYIAPYVSKMSWFVYVIRLDKDINQDSVIEYLNQEGVQCKPYFTPIHLQPFYRKMFGYKEGDFPVTEDVSGRTIALPFFNNLKEEQIDYVVEKLKEGIERNS